jgi:hypothetical protein
MTLSESEFKKRTPVFFEFVIAPFLENRAVFDCHFFIERACERPAQPAYVGGVEGKLGKREMGEGKLIKLCAVVLIPAEILFGFARVFNFYRADDCGVVAVGRKVQFLDLSGLCAQRFFEVARAVFARHLVSARVISA